MGVKVVDASALAAMLFGEPEGAVVAATLAGARLVAPALLWFEVANVCLVKCRRYPAQQVALVAAFELLPQFAIDIAEIPFGEGLALAAATGLTVYDASYLWAARSLQAELVTLDKQLIRVMAAGVPP